MSNEKELVLIGKVSATHGIRGQLKVHSFSGDSETFAVLKEVLIQESGKTGEWFDIGNVSAHGKKILLSLTRFNNINDVLHLVGRDILVRREQLPELDEDEYFWCDLLGLSVRTEQGELLGRLVDIIATGSNDVYVVQSGEREYLIPAIEDVVVDIDLDAGVMTISPMEGLFDL